MSDARQRPPFGSMFPFLARLDCSFTLRHHKFEVERLAPRQHQPQLTNYKQMSDEGASNNELLLAACKNDQDDMLDDIFKEGSYDINFRDGAGNTAAHYAAKHGALNCLEKLVNHDDIDLDIKNTLEGDTPLHKAVGYDEDPEIALAVVELLLEADADPRIKNRNQLTPLQLVDPRNKEMKDLISRATVAYQVGDEDIADEDNYDDDEDDIPSDDE